MSSADGTEISRGGVQKRGEDNRNTGTQEADEGEIKWNTKDKGTEEKGEEKRGGRRVIHLVVITQKLSPFRNSVCSCRCREVIAHTVTDTNTHTHAHTCVTHKHTLSFSLTHTCAHALGCALN